MTASWAMVFGEYILEQRNPQFILPLEEELQFTQSLTHRAADAVFWVAPDARFLYVNDAACRLAGYSCKELLCMTMYDVDPEFSPKVWLEHWKTMKQQGSLYFESLHWTQDGWSFPVEIGVTYLEYYGREYGCIFVRNLTERKQVEVALQKANEALERRVQELTAKLTHANEHLCRQIVERQRAEEALRQSEVRFRTLAETTDAIVFIVQDMRVCYVNPVAETLTGYQRGELLAHSNLRQLLEANECKHERNLWSSSGPPQYQEIEILTKSGEERWLDCSIGVFEFEGKPAKLVTAIDVTKRKQAELEIQATLEREEERSKQRASFVSMVSHEFRLPLHIISFSTSLLRRHRHHWPEEKKLRYLDCIQTSVKQLCELLDGVLITGRAEAGKLTFEPGALNLDQFCRNLVTEIQLSDSSSQYTVTFVSQGDCRATHVDEKLLRSILTNLLLNAIKYSPVGSTVILELSCRDGEAIFQIKDEGIGIPAADRQRLFEPFYRGGNVGDIPGTGLGLAVVKNLVDIHGGRITVASEVGVGTTFTIALPLARPLEAEVSTPLISTNSSPHS